MDAAASNVNASNFLFTVCSLRIHEAGLTLTQASLSQIGRYSQSNSVVIETRRLRSFPSGIDRLGHQKLRIGARLRMELLHSPGVHFGDVQISFLIHAHAVHAPQSSSEVTHAAPGVEQVSLQIPLDHFVRS